MNQQKSNLTLKELSRKIRHEYSIVDVIKNYINLTQKGNDFKGLCPFHGDNDPSLSVSTKLNIFKCFACNEAGNAIDFVMKYKKISYVDAIKEIVKLLNINEGEINFLLNNSYDFYNKDQQEIIDINEAACFIYHRTLFNSENKHVLKYLSEDRQIDESIIDFYQLGYAPNKNKTYLIDNLSGDEQLNRPALMLKAGLVNINDSTNDYSDFFFDRLIIPIKDENGKIVGFSGRALTKENKIKYLNTKTTDLFKKDNILFNFYSFNKSEYDEIYVVEGYMDVFALKKLGINNVVASMGTSFTKQHIELIKKHKNIQRIIICFDNDRAGREATKNLTEKLSKEKFNIFVVAPYDSQYKDVDELVKQKSKDECLKIINNQISFIQYYCETLKKKELSYKDKTAETENLINMINEFSYNPFLISDDLQAISNFSGISVSILNDSIRVTNKSSIFKTRYSDDLEKKISLSMDVYEEYKANEFKFVEKNIKLNIPKKELEKIRAKERDLIISLLYSRELYGYFYKYIGHVHFNRDGIIDKSLRTILYYADLYKNNPNLTIRKNVENMLNSEMIDIDEKKYLYKIINTFYESNSFSLSKTSLVIDRGLNLMIDIITAIYEEKLKNEYTIFQNENSEEQKLVNLAKERNKIKEERLRIITNINKLLEDNKKIKITIENNQQKG